MRKQPMLAGLIVLRLVLASVALISFAFTPCARAQLQSVPIEIPLGHCDRLPVVKLTIDTTEARFLVDTAATSMLNIKSVSAGRSKKVQITSWAGTSVTNGREVFLHTLSLGNHTIYNFKLEAVDLTPIATACGGVIDGILGVDLLEKLGVTIDLERSVARMDSLQGSAESPVILEMQSAMRTCWDAFNHAEVEKVKQCFDPNVMMSLPTAEYRGRERAVQYLWERYFQGDPHAHFEMKMSDQRAVGNVVWMLYDFSIESQLLHEAGRGMMICHKSGDRWYILSMHDAPVSLESTGVKGRP
ncbi:MAG: nuclear transport factor 2 family protein [Candidatus Acidiferrales bacterium]